MENKTSESWKKNQTLFLKHHVSHERLQKYLVLDDWQGIYSLITTFSIITFSFFIFAFKPNFWTFLVSSLLLGGRQIACGILLHEAVHQTLLSNKGFNYFFGKLCGNLVLIDFEPYQKEHLTHHRMAGDPLKDPDIGLVTPYPTTKLSMLRKVFRDLTGITGLKRLIAVLLMNFGYLTYSASTNVHPVDQSHLPKTRIFLQGFKRLSPALMTQACLWFVLYLAGQGTLYCLWVFAYLSPFSLFIRLRAIAEHACTPNLSHPLQSTRTVNAGKLAKLTIAPHFVHYHLEHHLLPAVPHYQLKKFHLFLSSLDFYKDSCVEKSYLPVLRKACSKA